MLCTQRRKWANSEQSPLGHWELTSSARMTANPGSKCLPEGRSGITKQRLTMRSYQITNQSRTVLIKLVFGYLPKKWFSHFCLELFALPQPKVLPLYYSAHGIRQLLFTWLQLFLLIALKLKQALDIAQWKSTTCLACKMPWVRLPAQENKSRTEEMLNCGFI